MRLDIYSRFSVRQIPVKGLGVIVCKRKQADRLGPAEIKGVNSFLKKIDHTIYTAYSQDIN